MKRGCKTPEEVKAKMSAAKREWYLHNKPPFLGKHHSETTKEKMRIARKGWFQKNNHPNLGRHLAQDTKEKISISLSQGKETTLGHGYSRFYDPIDSSGYQNKCIYEHRKIWEREHNKKIPNGFLVHHIDRNKANNQISNLLLISREDHPKLHRILRRADGRTKQ